MSRSIEHVRELRTRWQIRFTDNRRRPKEKTFSFRKTLFSRREIIQERNRLYAAWHQGWDPWSGVLPGQAGSGPITLTEAIERYCTHKRGLGQKGQQGGWNARTEKDYRLRLGAFARLAGPHRRITELASADLERYIFEQGTAQATQRTRRRMLRTFTGYLEKEGHLVPGLLRVPPPFVERLRRPVVFTELDVLALCDAHRIINRDRTKAKHAPKAAPDGSIRGDNLWFCDFMLIAFYQGLRRGENLNLIGQVIDLDERRMYVGHRGFIPKGRDENVITITLPALAVFERRIRGKARSDYLWPRISEGHASRLFRRALEKAVAFGLVAEEKAGLSLHDLRRGCLEYWLRRGVDIVACQELLRHKDIKTTMKHYKAMNVDHQTRAFDLAYGDIRSPVEA